MGQSDKFKEIIDAIDRVVKWGDAPENGKELWLYLEEVRRLDHPLYLDIARELKDIGISFKRLNDWVSFDVGYKNMGNY